MTREQLLQRGIAVENQQDLTTLNTELYEGCGNLVLITFLPEVLRVTDFRNNFRLRGDLAEIGQRQGVDSIMVLTGSPFDLEEQGFDCAMDVFEPNGSDRSGMAGSWSTMCGNGVRAVARYLLDHKAITGARSEIFIMTRSGLRTVEILSDGLFRVRMGEFTAIGYDLKRYILLERLGLTEDDGLIDIQIPSLISAARVELEKARTCSIGLTGDQDKSGEIDGEPHVVIMVKDTKDLTKLREIAVLAGPVITKAKDIFPLEINASFITIRKIDKVQHYLEVDACTHERGLGASPDHSVTAACGTGATVIGAVLFRLKSLDDDWKVAVRMPGGVLLIERKDNSYYLTGPAKKVE